MEETGLPRGSGVSSKWIVVSRSSKLCCVLRVIGSQVGRSVGRRDEDFDFVVIFLLLEFESIRDSVSILSELEEMALLGFRTM